MANRLKIKIIIDIAMTIAMILLMGYMLTGDLAHEIIGTIMILLWIFHHFLNRKWYTSLIKGKFSLRRIINIIINVLLLFSVIGIIISSLILSSYVFSFLGITSGMSFARILHMVCVYWAFILSSFHLGLHWSLIIKIIETRVKVKPSKLVAAISHTAAIILSVYGLYSFLKQQILSYMFMQTQFVFFDFSQSVLSFYAEYITIMIFFASISYYLSVFINKIHLSRRPS